MAVIEPNPFRQPELLHPELAVSIAEVEEWQADHDSSAEISISGIAEAVQTSISSEALRKENLNFPDSVAEAYDTLTDLISDIGDSTNLLAIPPLENAGFSRMNWEKLERAFDSCRQKGLDPTILFAPQNRAIQFWTELYGRLHAWEETQSDNPTLFANNHNSGLMVDPLAEQNWATLTKSDSNWSAVVIPSTLEPPITDIRHAGLTLPGRIRKTIELESILLAPTDRGRYNQVDVDPTIEEYLMLQAIRVYKGKQPLDTQHATWLRGTYSPNYAVNANASSSSTWATSGSFNNKDGGVKIKMHTDVTSFSTKERNGMRPVIREQSPL